VTKPSQQIKNWRKKMVIARHKMKWLFLAMTMTFKKTMTMRQEDNDELDYKETTMGRGQKLTRKAMPAKSWAKDKGPVDVNLANNNDDDSLLWI
jgi:hydroxyacyl-ACP dehydratase HTD2-like protein with hotdog domain